MRPPAAALDLIAGRTQAGQTTPAAPAGAHRMDSTQQQEPLQSQQTPMDANTMDVEARDSRSSSSTNSPLPRDNDESDFYAINNDSESSLGVMPNLQDMQVNDMECLPPAATLPSEILISIFSRLNSPADMFRCMLVSKRWARNVVEMLWHRPTCTSWEKHTQICQTLQLQQPTFAYPEFIKRLNLATLSSGVSDGSVIPLAVCTRVERLTLTNCKELTDVGLKALVQNSPHLLALDISQDDKITEASVLAIADNCPRLQGLNVTNCKRISNESMMRLAESCKYIKRLKLNDCDQLNDDAVMAFANNCPNILEIDLHSCRNIGNEPVTALLARGQSLRELRLANCELIDDSAFLSLSSNRIYEHLRILDLTCCTRLTDRAVEKIIDVAPRLRNLVLAKCGNITDAAVYAISRLGKNLHYVHLGHCRHITDDAVKRLVHCCNRIRYIDLGCCQHLTDESVTRLATLPKLKRIGLVRCSNITDESMYALAKANQRARSRRDANGNVVTDYHHSSSLERVHLSYCVNLTLPSIIRLLNACPKLTHLSLTGVTAFLRDDLDTFCRDAPPDFTEHQRQVFCVFSGRGVTGLKDYLNSKEEFAQFQTGAAPRILPIHDADTFEENDVVEDDDMGEGSDLAAGPDNDDAQTHNMGVPPPPPPAPATHGPEPRDTSWLAPQGTSTDNASGSRDDLERLLLRDTSHPAVALDTFASSTPQRESTTPTQEMPPLHMAPPTFQHQAFSSQGPSTAGGTGQSNEGPSTASLQSDLTENLSE
ncbi:SCF ubiquitin ligase complex subunit [Pestalotiopsis sp. 9143b]|nr:SCF ubiquitin ligase complex subunit [Pestalotiopsis sp. 9143b]